MARSLTRMRRKAALVLAVLLLAASLAGCVASDGIVQGAVPDKTRTSDPAKHAACITNEQTFEMQVATWSAANPGAPVPLTLADLQAQGVVSRTLTCPNGGTYTWDASALSLTCSVDGHWK